VQASLEQRQRFQQLFFPDGIAFDGNGFLGTAVTAPAFSYLRPMNGGNEGLVDHMVLSWNHILDQLKQLDTFRRTLVLSGFWPQRPPKRGHSNAR
jgi:hypothetical protein